MSNESLRSGELARQTGVSADTLRHYEKLGILPTSQRTNGGYGMFPLSSVERVQLAQAGVRKNAFSSPIPHSSLMAALTFELVRLADVKILGHGDIRVTQNIRTASGPAPHEAHGRNAWSGSS